MIIVRSVLDVADNTGAKKVACIGVIGKKNKTHATIGDVVSCHVREITGGEGQVKKGEVVRAVIVRTSHPIRRKDGVTIKFDRNACVIIDKQGNPRGTRVFGPVARELREKFGKILSLAPEVV